MNIKRHIGTVLITTSLILILTIIGCKEIKENNEMDKITIYTYADGSGNDYVISNEGRFTIEYNPVKPFMSSSGSYDGGDYLKQEITAEEYGQVAELFARVIEDREFLMENREMLTGMFIIEQNGESKRYIQSSGSPLKAEAEELLARLAGR